jgi:hypothetical protein
MKIKHFILNWKVETYPPGQTATHTMIYKSIGYILKKIARGGGWLLEAEIIGKWEPGEPFKVEPQEPPKDDRVGVRRFNFELEYKEPRARGLFMNYYPKRTIEEISGILWNYRYKINKAKIIKVKELQDEKRKTKN